MNTNKDLPSLPSEATRSLGGRLAEDSEHFEYLNATPQPGSQSSGDRAPSEEPEVEDGEGGESQHEGGREADDEVKDDDPRSRLGFGMTVKRSGIRWSKMSQNTTTASSEVPTSQTNQTGATAPDDPRGESEPNEEEPEATEAPSGTRSSKSRSCVSLLRDLTCGSDK